MTSIAKLARIIGSRVLVRVLRDVRPSELWFPADVRDVREVFGRVDYLIAPVGGEGQAWVSAENTRPTKEGEEK